MLNFAKFAKNLANFWQKIEITELCKGVHCVDLGESFQTHIYLQNLSSLQPRTSNPKFALWPSSKGRAPLRFASRRTSSELRTCGRGCCTMPSRARDFSFCSNKYAFLYIHMLSFHSVASSLCRFFLAIRRLNLRVSPGSVFFCLQQLSLLPSFGAALLRLALWSNGESAKLMCTSQNRFLIRSH